MTDKVNKEIVRQIFTILQESPGISTKVVGPSLGVSAELVAKASAVLYRGTEEEKRQVLAGEASVSTVGRNIRKREKRTILEKSHVADNRREQADLYQKLKDAVEAIAGLPRVEDMVNIVRSVRRGNALIEALPRATAYLVDFKFEMGRKEGIEFIEGMKNVDKS